MKEPTFEEFWRIWNNATRYPEDLRRDVKLLIDAERERCAKVCEDRAIDHKSRWNGKNYDEWIMEAEQCAAAIRGKS